MQSNKVYDVVYIGNYTKDTITSPAGIKYVDGGAVNYAAHAAACLGYHVAVVTRLAKEDQRVVDKFLQAGIDCFPTYTPDSTLMRLDYPTLNPDIRELSVAATAGSVTAADVMDINAKAAVIGSSLRGEVGLDVIEALWDKKVTVAVDMQGFVRVLRGKTLFYEAWPEMQSALAHVHILKSDAVEAQHLTGETDIYRAARFYADIGPQEIVLTHKDGLLVYAGGECFEAGFFPLSLDGRSGRGDTCLGSYTALRLAMPPREACIWAAAVTSLKMERLGPFDRPVSDVEALISAKYRNGSTVTP